MTIKRYSLDPKKLPRLLQSDLERIDRMRDEDIDYSDIPELDDEFFARATRVEDRPRRKAKRDT